MKLVVLTAKTFFANVSGRQEHEHRSRSRQARHPDGDHLLDAVRPCSRNPGRMDRKQEPAGVNVIKLFSTSLNVYPCQSFSA